MRSEICLLHLKIWGHRTCNPRLEDTWFYSMFNYPNSTLGLVILVTSNPQWATYLFFLQLICSNCFQGILISNQILTKAFPRIPHLTTLNTQFVVLICLYLNTPFIYCTDHLGDNPVYVTPLAAEVLPPCILCFAFTKWSCREPHTFLQTAYSVYDDVAISVQEFFAI